MTILRYAPKEETLYFIKKAGPESGSLYFFMLISVKVHPSSPQENIEHKKGYRYEACIKEPSKDGKANQALLELLSKYFSVPTSFVILKRGLKSRNKIFEIKNSAQFHDSMASSGFS